MNSLEEDVLSALKTCKEFSDIVFKIEARSDKQQDEGHAIRKEEGKETEEDKKSEREKEKEKEQGQEDREKPREPEPRVELVDRHEDFRFIYAHKCILAARSDYFKVMFAAGMKESEFSLDFATEVEGEEAVDVPSPSFETQGGEADSKDTKGKEKLEHKGEAAKGQTFAGLLAERSIPIEGISFETFVHILRFIYSGTSTTLPPSLYFQDTRSN